MSIDTRGGYRPHIALWVVDLLILPLLVQGLPLVDVSIGAPTAKTVSISYTWQLAASVAPATVAMPFTESRMITWIINATRAVNFVGSLTGSVRLARPLTATGGAQWSAVGVSVKQGANVYLSTNAVCTPGNQFLPMGSSSDYLAQSYAVINCAFSFGPNLGPGANAFSPGGVPPDLLGQSSPNRVFELSANITLSTGQVEQSSNTQSFTFDVTAPAGSAAGSPGIVGECAVVRDAFSQVTAPMPLTFAPPTDGVSNPTIPSGSPPALQQQVCVATNFAYTMTIPATQRVCGDFSFTSAASLAPVNSNQQSLSGSAYTRSARATITGCDQAAVPSPAVPGVPPPVVPGAPAPVLPPVVQPVVPPPPVITPVPQPTPVVPPPVITPVVVPPPVAAPAIQPAVVLPPAVYVAPVVYQPPVVAPAPVQATSPQQQPSAQQQPVQQPAGQPTAAPAAAAADPPSVAASAPQAQQQPPAAPGPAATPPGNNPGAPGGRGPAGPAAAALPSNGSAGASPQTAYIPPVLPSATPQPLLVRITSVGGYQVNKPGFVWSARTSVSPDQLLLRSQARGRLAFSVEFQKASLSAGSYVMGAIMVTNPNAQIAHAPGLTLTIAGADSGSGRAPLPRRADGSVSTLEAQVDCVSGQANARSAVSFRVPSGGSITCTFIAQLPSSGRGGDGGTVTAGISSIKLGASQGVTAQGSSSDGTPWAFAPNPVVASGECARVSASVTPTDDKLQVVGPADSLSGDQVPAAGKVICSAAMFNFSGDFGPISSKQGRRCGAQVILSATAKQQGSDAGLSAALAARGTSVVPIDEPGCRPRAEASMADDASDGSPAIRALRVDVSDLSPASVTEYAWRIKLGMAPAKKSVKWNASAAVKSKVEVTRTVNSFTRRLSGVVNIYNTADTPFTILDVAVNATLDQQAQGNNSRGGISVRGSDSTAKAAASQSGSSNKPDSGGGSSGGTSRGQQLQPPAAGSRGLRKLQRLLQQAFLGTPSKELAGQAAGAAAQPVGQQGPSTGSDLVAIMLGTSTDSSSPSSSQSTASSSGGGGGRRAVSPTPPSTSSRGPSAAAAPTGPAIAATVTCPANKGGAMALAAATRRGGSLSPSSVSCKFVLTLPSDTTLQSTGRLWLAVVAMPGAAAGSSGSSSSSSGRLRGQASFSMQNSKPQTLGACARVTVSPPTQPLAPNPLNQLQLRPMASGRSGRQQQPPARAPDGDKVCDSSSYSFGQLVGPVKGEACGTYEVVSVATAEPESSSQGAQQVLASASVVFGGCNSTAMMPTIRINNLTSINFTTFTWTLSHSVSTAKGASLTPTASNSSSITSSSRSVSGSEGASPSAAATAAATATSAAAVNTSASAFLSRRSPGDLVIPHGKNISESVIIMSEFTRLPGVDNGLYGLEGRVVASAPGDRPMEVAGLWVGIARPGDESPVLIPALCSAPPAAPSRNSGAPSNSSSSSSSTIGPITLPAPPEQLNCFFNYTTTTPVAGLVTGVAVLQPAVLGSSGRGGGGRRGDQNSTAADTGSPSFLGLTERFGFAPDSGAVKRDLGACVLAAELTGMEVKVGDDLLLPLVRTLSDTGLPQLYPKNSAGKNVTLLPNPKPTKGTVLPDKTQLCESRVQTTTLRFGPFDSKTCSLETQFFAAARIAPTPLQPKGMTREFTLPLEVSCTTKNGTRSSGSGDNRGKDGSSTGPFIRYAAGQGNLPNSQGRKGAGGTAGEGLSRASAGSSSSRRSTQSAQMPVDTQAPAVDDADSMTN